MRGMLCRFGNGERFLVPRGQPRFVIGRSADCDLVIWSGAMSKRHSAITRVGERWLIQDLKSTPGTYVDGRRITGPTELAIGMRIEYADHQIQILDLDYEARPGELAPRIDRTLVVTCPGLICRARVSLWSLTSNAETDDELARLLVGSAGTLEADRLSFADPVELVLGVERVRRTLYDTRPGGVHVQSSIHDVVIGAAALELLTEDTEPARRAWGWLESHMRIPQLRPSPRNTRGLVASPRPASKGIVGELASEIRVDGRGVLAWVHANDEGSVLWIDRDILIGEAEEDGVTVDLHLRGFRFSPVLANLRCVDGRWEAEVTHRYRDLPPQSYRLEVGGTLELDGWVFEVLAIGA